MLYMVIERLKDAPAIYRRLHEKGRMMPEGLEYVSSWIDVDLKTCWQLMRAEDESLFQTWTRPHIGRSTRDDGKVTIGTFLAPRGKPPPSPTAFPRAERWWRPPRFCRR